MTGPSADHSGDVGRVVDGRFRLLEKIGETRRAVTYRAAHEGIGRQVHVKTLRSSLPPEGPDAARLHLEARAAGSVTHKNVQSVVDSGVDDTGRPFVVYEALEGATLESMLAASPKGLVTTQAAKLMLQVLDGLRAIHRGGVVHRALRPACVRVLALHGGHEVAKITCFDDAVFVAEAASAEPVERVGDPMYYAPELRRSGASVDPRVDIYAAGALLRALLTGRPAAGGMLSDAARRAVDRAMAESPDDRFGDADSFIHAVLLLTQQEVRPHDLMLTPADGLHADLHYLLRRRSVHPALTPRARADARVDLLPVLLTIEGIYRLFGDDAWTRLVALVPDVERLLPAAGDVAANVAQGVPAALFTRILAAADLVGGQGNMSVVVDIGDAIAKRGLRRMRPELPDPLTPDALVDGFAGVWGRISRSGTVTIVERAPTSARIAIRGQLEPSVELCALVAGLTRGSLKLTGVREITVHSTGCQALGDPACVLSLAWKT